MSSFNSENRPYDDTKETRAAKIRRAIADLESEIAQLEREKLNYEDELWQLDHPSPQKPITLDEWAERFV